MDLVSLVGFLAGLEQNNNKAWFEANRGRYDALRADFIDLVEEVVFGVAAFDPRIQGVVPKATLFRIHRDVRFARDKSPYKTTFSSSISDRGRIGAPGYYFQVDHTGKLMVGGGLWMPDADALARIRTYIATRPGALEVEVKSLDEDAAAPFIVDTFRAMYPAIQWLRDAVRAPLAPG